jgi:putative acetyltransferase
MTMPSSEADPAPITVHITRADLAVPTAQALLDALDAELTARYPEERANAYRIDPEEVSGTRGVFLLAVPAAGDEALGCCALRRLADGTGEVKRMYVRPEARGRGVARALLTAIEAEARALGIARLVLETGVRQPEAVALYGSFGFVRIPVFGTYEESPLSLCMGKDLMLAGASSGP